MRTLKESDPEIAKVIENELVRQRDELNMIPSENYVTRAVLEATGSIMTNKYAEGYPKKRYYQGNVHVDDAELIAIDRAKKLFDVEHVNVQPNSGSPANMAVYRALLKRGDKVMGLDLSHGGHLTHGSPVNFSGQDYEFVAYTVDKETGILDLQRIRALVEKEKPKLIITGYTAYPRVFPFKEMHDMAKSVGAFSMADISHIAGLIAGGAHPSPAPFTDVITTTTHKTLRGPRGAMIMCKEEFAKAIDKAVFPGLQGGPHMHSITAKAVAFKEASTSQFKDYAHQIVKNAKVLAKTLMDNDIALVSDGTDTHLLLIDLIRTKSIGEMGKGKEVAVALEESGIITNMNTVPFDPSTPFRPSGIRLGTPTLTTRGMKEKEMEQVGVWIAEVIKNLSDHSIRPRIRQKVKELCGLFEFY